MDRGTWWATVRRVAKSQTPVKLLSTRQSDLPRALGLPLAEMGLGPGITASSLFLSGYSLPVVWEACICSELVPRHSK